MIAHVSNIFLSSRKLLLTFFIFVSVLKVRTVVKTQTSLGFLWGIANHASGVAGSKGDGNLPLQPGPKPGLREVRAWGAHEDDVTSENMTKTTRQHHKLTHTRRWF